MSYYSDGEPFDEYDYPWCENCKGGNSKAECDRCYKMHTAVDDEEPIEEEYAERPAYYEEFLKKAHKRRRRK